MNDKCRLCKCEKELRVSHIIPKFFINCIKANSPVENTRIRSTLEPNKPLQDGLKLPFLCAECEEKLSKFETFFSNNYMKNDCFKNGAVLSTDSNELRYFVLSMAWRVLQYDAENGIKQEINGGITEKEKIELERVIEKWRNHLSNESYDEINKIQMHLIPLKAFDISCDNGLSYPTNGISFTWRCYGGEDSFEYAFVFIKTPVYFFTITTWGNTVEMNSLTIGNDIEVIPHELSNFIFDQLSEQQKGFVDAFKKLTEPQIKAMMERAGKNKKKSL